MSSGRLTETCTCPQTAVAGGSRNDMGTGHGGNITAAEARRDRRDLTAGEKATGGEAEVERGGGLTRSERTDSRPDPDTLTGGTIGI